MFRKLSYLILLLITIQLLWVAIPQNSNLICATTDIKTLKSITNTYSPSFEDGIVQITTNTGSDYNPYIFRDNLDRFWILWANGSGANGIIWANYYNESSNTLGTPFRITDNPNDDWNPTGFLDHRGVLWIFWQSDRDGDYDIWYKNSSNNGGLWSTAYQLTNTTTNEGTPYCAMDGLNNFWVFYETSNGGSKDIVYKTSSNNASSWTPTQSISVSSGLIHEEIQDIFISDDNELFLLVQELVGTFKSYLWTTQNSGINWIKHEISSVSNTGWGTIFGEENNICVIVWRSNNLYFFNSTDPANGWSQENQLIDSNSYIQQPNGGIYTNSTLYTVFVSNQTGNWEVFLEITFPDILIEDKDNLNTFEDFFPALFAIMVISAIIITIPYLWGKRDGDQEIKSDIQLNYQLLSIFYSLFGNIVFKQTISRLSVDEVEMNDLRHRILDLLHDYDFLHFRDLKRITNKGTSHLRWHLKILTEFKYIQYSQTGQYLIYYLATKKPPNEYIHVYFNLLSRPSLMIASAFSRNDLWRISDLKTQLELPEKTVRYHCKKLEKVNIIQKEGKSLFKLNGFYGEWIKKVIFKRENA